MSAFQAQDKVTKSVYYILFNNSAQVVGKQLERDSQHTTRERESYTKSFLKFSCLKKIMGEEEWSLNLLPKRIYVDCNPVLHTYTLLYVCVYIFLYPGQLIAKHFIFIAVIYDVTTNIYFKRH